jgi:hypothetical protein
MLIRISLIVAIVAGLAVAVVNFVQVKEVITTTRETLNTTSNQLVTTTANLRTTSQERDGLKSKLAVTEGKLKTTEEARDTALADAETNRKKAADLTERLDKTTKERDDAQANLAQWKVLGIPVDQIKVMIAELNQTKEAVEVAKEENKILSTKVKNLENDLAYYRDPDYRVHLPEGLKGKVLVSDPKWDFVVLNIGQDQGVLDRGELLINRDGKLVAKVRVLRVEKDRCIANLVPGWKLGEVIEGDSAIPAF